MKARSMEGKRNVQGRFVEIYKVLQGFSMNLVA